MVWDRADTYFRADEFYDLWSDICWWPDLENGAVRYRLQGDRLPRRVVCRLMQDYSIRAVEKFSGRCFEVGRGGIEDREIEIGAEELQDAVGFHDCIARRGEAMAQSGHRFGEPSLLGAHPENSRCSSHQKTRCIGLSGPVMLFCDCP